MDGVVLGRVDALSSIGMGQHWDGLVPRPGVDGLVPRPGLDGLVRSRSSFSVILYICLYGCQLA